MASASRWKLRGAFFWLPLLGVVAAGCGKSPSPASPDMAGPVGNQCATSNDCGVGTGVCRAGKCTMAPCSAMLACTGTCETCGPSNTCVPGGCEGPPPCFGCADCPAGTVCRAGRCAIVVCAMNMDCLSLESCTQGVCFGCEGVTKGTPGRSIAAGGSVATSGKHIHIGLTGQGKAVGTGRSATHQHVGGASAVMQR